MGFQIDINLNRAKISLTVDNLQVRRPTKRDI